MAASTVGVERSLLISKSMNDKEKSTEEQVEKIEVIRGPETLGYEGSAHGEHSGQNEPREGTRLTDDLADNKPEQVKP